ncbi:MAG: cytochrome b/b6 domain-containing protein [Magnetovibrio sp.]|nr:cytochrome b/b6 domain-containing protein [Magnetovibrio sp.]
MTNRTSASKTLRVWDLAVRLFHWACVALVLVTYFSSDWMDLHFKAGYLLLVLVFFRLIWGLLGTKYARFSQFVRSWPQVWTYTKGMLKGTPKHFVGHNPLGGWMIVALLVALMLAILTGLYSSDDWSIGPFVMLAPTSKVTALMAGLHEEAANVLMILALVHVVGVIANSILSGENLVRTMITGEKACKASQDQEDLSVAPLSGARLIRGWGALGLSLFLTWLISRWGTSPLNWF